MNNTESSLRSSGSNFGWALLVTLISLVVNVLATLAGSDHSIFHLFKIDLAPMGLTPSSYSLAIWGLIYGSLLAYFAYQARVDHMALGLLGFAPFGATRNSVSAKQFRQINRWLIVIGIAQAAWCWLFASRQFVLALVPLMVVLAALTTIYQILGIGLVFASRRRRRFCHPAFSAYLAWSTVLCCLTVAASLYGWGWRDRTDIGAVLAMVAMVLISLRVISQHRDGVFTLTIVASLVMIGLNHPSSSRIVITAVLGAVGLLGCLGVSKRPVGLMPAAGQGSEESTSLSGLKSTPEP